MSAAQFFCSVLSHIREKAGCMSVADHAETQDTRTTLWVLEDMVEQQRIANLIALANLADRKFGNYAGEAGGMGVLFSYGKTPESNIRLRDEIAYALKIRTPQTPVPEEER